MMPKWVEENYKYRVSIGCVDGTGIICYCDIEENVKLILDKLDHEGSSVLVEMDGMDVSEDFGR